MLDAQFQGDDALILRKMKELPNITAAALRSASAMAKFAAERAALATDDQAPGRATRAVQAERLCLQALLELESALARDGFADQVAAMSHALAVSASALEAARAAVEPTPAGPHPQAW